MTATEQITKHMANLSVQEAEHLEELIECARYGELEEIQAVVESSGAEKAKMLLSQQGDYGKTPLHMAAANGHLVKRKKRECSVITYLQCGHQRAVEQEKSELHARNIYMESFIRKHEYMTKNLLNAKVVDIQQMLVHVVEYLITIISPEAINIQNDQGNTALHWAATNGHHKVVETLITKGKADYKLKNAAGHTAMLEAEMHEREQVVAWMLINTELEEELKEGGADDEDDEESSDDDDEEETPEDKQVAQGSSSSATKA
ncbi:hypothetical protein BGZ50_009743 [Haplosporangium sp. Z 11]|nr:hypothetical protein BGZ50_009743 [Haplosporangium sp. Z 11]